MSIWVKEGDQWYFSRDKTLVHSLLRCDSIIFGEEFASVLRIYLLSDVRNFYVNTNRTGAMVKRNFCPAYKEGCHATRSTLCDGCIAIPQCVSKHARISPTSSKLFQKKGVFRYSRLLTVLAKTVCKKKRRVARTLHVPSTRQGSV